MGTRHSPRKVDDQVTYPLSTALLGIPALDTIRSFSAFHSSVIYVAFDKSVDASWSPTCRWHTCKGREKNIG